MHTVHICKQINKIHYVGIKEFSMIQYITSVEIVQEMIQRHKMFIKILILI